ncbi:MAG: hypothetical protein KGJ13_11055, partial [Patescibacteria group bacterium]|nr:hypothetical protein [Patescibacteria group bacterium]
HAGVVVKFRRGSGGWVGDCQNPGVLSALLGQEEGLEIRAASFMREAGEQFTRAASSGHSREHCPHKKDRHSWADCPAAK